MRQYTIYYCRLYNILTIFNYVQLIFFRGTSLRLRFNHFQIKINRIFIISLIPILQLFHRCADEAHGG